MSRWRGRAGAPTTCGRAGERIEALLEASAAGGVVARERAEELVRLVADLYGAGLERLLEIARRRGPARRRRCSTRWPPTTWWPACCWCTACTRTTSSDPGRAGAGRACGPTSARTAATSSCSRSPTTGVVRLRLLGSCDGCASSAVTLELAVEDAIEAAAPEIAAIEVEDDRREPAAPGVIPVDVAARPARRRRSRRRRSAWRAGCPSSTSSPSARCAGIAVGGVDRRCVCRVGADRLRLPRPLRRAAARRFDGRRPARGSRGDAGERGAHAARACGAHFDVRRAGAGLEDDGAAPRPAAAARPTTASSRSPSRRRSPA